MARKKRSKRSGGGGGGGGGQIIIPSTLSSSSSAREDPPEEYNHVQQTTSIKINSTLPDPPPLSNDEEEQYEEYQEQLYRHRRGDYTRNPQQTTTTQITSFQQSTVQAGRPKNQSQSHSGGIISSTHRQFDLTPLSDVEMTSLGGRKQKCKKEKAFKGNGNYAIYQTSSYTGRYNGLQMQNTPVDATKGRNAINPLEYNGQVLAYLDDGESSSSEESIEGRRSRRYEGYYTKQLNKSRDDEYYNRVNRSLDEILDDDDDSSGSNDEERPLMSSLHGPEAILSRWEIWLNRTLVLLFVTICFIAGTERTPWWKEHKRRVASLSHHHHHILAGTDDDDFDIDLDPMTVYNTNDFDATRTRDHDPLHLYDHITMKGDMMDDEARGKYDAKKLGNDTAIIKKKYNSKDKNEDEGKKISQSPNDSSPTKSKTPLKEVDVDDMASLLNDEWDKGVSQKKEEASAGELISKRPPSKSLHHGFVDKVIQPDSVAKTSGGVMGGGSSITKLKDPPKAPPLSNPVHPDDDNLVEWDAPDD
jgi:hypothetical protein